MKQPPMDGMFLIAAGESQTKLSYGEVAMPANLR
jgi:hypothetical protein